MVALPLEDAEKTQAELLAENTALRSRLAAAEAAMHDPLRMQERQALLILNEMHQFVALLDTQGNELETNQTSLDAVGLRREDCIGRPFWEIPVWPDSILKDLQASFQHVIATGEFMRFEVEFFMPGKETELLTTDITLKPIRNAQGEVAFVVLEGRDITERKRAEAEVARQHAELQMFYEQVRQLDQLKSMFFAMMNHELRTPLTLILGPIESLLQQVSLTQQTRQTLEVVRRNARLLFKLVNDLLEVSRLEQGKLELHYESCDLSRLVHLLAANFDTVAAERQLTYRVQTPPHLFVEIDPARIERVLLNLLSNAFKFTPDGGRITCSLETMPASESGSETPAQVVLCVQDSGPGVPAELREVIFERFRQSEEGAKRRFGGTGLGLAIVKELVSLHEGTIRVDEAPGGGARFTVCLPQRAPAGTHVQREEDDTSIQGPTDARLLQAMVEEVLPAQQAHAGISSPSPSTESEPSLILIVEDHSQLRQFLSAQLASRYRVAEARNGREGLTLVGELHPDLVLTDIMMPVMSGEEMLAALRAEPIYDDIMVVVLTARGDEDQRLRLLRAGAQDYLVKPFSTEELQVRLGNLLTLHRTRRLLQGELASSQHDIESLTRELTVQKRELEQANRAKSQFLSTMSHELRTPLTAILGFSQVLLATAERVRWSQQHKDDLLRILKNGQHLLALVNDVLDIAKIETGRVEITASQVELSVLLASVLAEVQSLARERHLILRAQVETGAEFLETDPMKLHQILLNLVGNAIKFTEQGEVTITATCATGSSPSADRIAIAVTDTGIGIAPELHERIFDPFYQVESGYTRRFGGTGLGLAIVRQFTTLLGGTVDVASHPGEGSIFTVTLPCKVETRPRCAAVT